LLRKGHTKAGQILLYQRIRSRLIRGRAAAEAAAVDPSPTKWHRGPIRWRLSAGSA